MDEPVTISLFGIDELDKFFGEMARADQRALFIDAWRIASKPMISQARANIRSRRKRKSRSNNLSKSMGFVPLKGRKLSVYTSAKIGARRFGNNKGFHGHLFDQGTAERTTKRGFKRGAASGTRFFKDSEDANISNFTKESEDNMIAALEKLIQRKMKKL